MSVGVSTTVPRLNDLIKPREQRAFGGPKESSISRREFMHRAPTHAHCAPRASSAATDYPSFAYYFDLTLGRTWSDHKSQARASGAGGGGAEGRARARAQGVSALVRGPRPLGLFLLFIPPRLVKKPGTRIYRGNIEMRDTGRGLADEGECVCRREREGESGDLSLSPCASVHTSQSPPPPSPRSHTLAPLRLPSSHLAPRPAI